MCHEEEMASKKLAGKWRLPDHERDGSIPTKALRKESSD